ncbi:uncharacterized protein LOC126843902 [Adelges cooleyi]|uniref:uncharacterized protein LOC126843902 n=1 Tax=Adelges cooleyi TaxID=133065 RepID=UPI00217F7512|nr:uncharacterized protein LOC126843902 [Adelges cooleyi]
MFTKYILLFCLTYYIPKVDSMDEVEIEILWDTIRGESDFINHDHFRSYFKDEDQSELLSVIETYGHKCTAESQSKGENRMDLKEFTKAASEGCINICSKQAIDAVFNKIIANKKNGDHITSQDMIQYYGLTVPLPQIEYVISKYVVGQKHLNFSALRKAINTGDLPKPWRDEIAIRAEIEHLFNKMKNKESDYVSNVHMSFYYGGFNDIEFQNTAKNYGTEHNFEDEAIFEDGQYRMRIDDFQRAGSDGYIPRFSKKLINDEFKKITLETEDRNSISFEELVEYYKTKIPVTHIEYIIRNYGETQDGQRRMNLNGFTRAINGGYLPNLLCDAVKAMYTLFKDILPKDVERNHILLDDMVKYYKTKEPHTDLYTLRKILKKFGQYRGATSAERNHWEEHFDYQWNGGQYMLNFANFRRSMEQEMWSSFSPAEMDI